MKNNQQKAFKFYKNEATYPNVRRVMQGEPHHHEHTPKYVNIMKQWFSGPNVRRGNLTGVLYRGIPFHPKGNTLNNKSFTSWTPRLNKALRFMAGSKNGSPGVILVMNARKVPAYVRYNTGPPTYFNRVLGNTEEEVLLPPGRMVLGARNKKVTRVKSIFGNKNVEYSSVNVLNYH